MDSGSSGSMQSSSGGGGGGGGGGGDEEYDSRSASISSFLNHPSSGHFGSISNPQPPLLSHQQSSHQPTFFDTPHSQNLDAFPQSLETQNASLPYNHEMVWSRGLRSEANYGNFGNLKGSSSSSLSSSHSLLGVQGINQAPLASSSQPVEGNATRAALQQFDQPVPNVAKNPKKRTRASRRAPTTVLTTDTANFRQMVQEFTGIPTSPFSTGSPYSRRLDLFSTAGSAMRAGQLDTLGSLYPLRPSAQKAQPSSTSPSLFNSSVINALVSNNNASGTNNNINTSIAGTSNSISSSTNNFQVPLNLGLPKQSQNILNMQNPLLTFQPLLQPTLPSSMGNEPFLSTRAQGSTSMPLDELGMRHQQVNANLSGFSNQGGSEARQARNDDDTARWRDGGTLNNEGQEHLRSFDGNDGNGQRISSFKLNSSSSSDFNPEKVLDNASSGGLEFTNYN